MTSDRNDELIALVALGELTPAEALELDDAVRADPVLAAELDEALAAAAAVQAASPEVPPTGLRGNVLAAIREVPQDGGVDADASPDAAAVVSLDDRRRRRLITLVTGAAAAAVLLIGGVVVVSQDRGASDDLVAVTEAPDAVTQVLDGEMGGSLLVTYSPSENAVVVEGRDVPVLSEAETYQLWLIDDGGPTPAGLFRPDDDGSVMTRLDGIDASGVTLAVTEEPAGGSEAPTLPILAST
jgi:anti-sigma-K factor RskA